MHGMAPRHLPGDVMNASLPTSAQRYTLAEIADVLKVSKQAVAQRSNREEWGFEETAGRGGMKRHYPLASLPKDIRESLQQHEMKKILVPATPVVSLASA